jgi:murein DD-endopeptidase MepM/ murein hydrolase activator NlpD
MLLASGVALGSAFASWGVLSPWETATAAGTYLRPCGNVPISDSWQGHKNRNPTSGEPGTDYSVGRGTAVVAATDGVIVDRKDTTSTATGRYLALQADDGNYIRYLHLDSSAVPVGTRVARGQVIAYSGASGFDSNTYYGAHVHVSLWIGGSPFQLGFKNSVDFENYIGDNAPNPEPEPVPEEDEMAYPIVCNGRAYLVAPGFIKSLNTQPDADLTRNIVSATDAWIELTPTRFLGQLSSFGIPGSVVNLTTGAVTNAETGVQEGGGVWTWARLAVVNTNRILAKLG